MTEQNNPYQAPQADLTPATQGEAGDITLTEPKKLPIGAGWSWIAEGFGLFKKSPGLWIGMIIVWFVLMFIMAFIPLIGSLATSLLGPVFLAGFMLGCRELERGGSLDFNHLFAGFSNNTGQLILVGVLYLVAIIIAIIPGGIVMGGSLMAMMAGDPSAMSEVNAGALSIGFLLMLAFILPAVMAYWFAPALVVLHDMSAVDAMKTSFKGCLRNMLPYLWYGVIATILYILAAIPLGLGLLVLIPTLLASMYTAYRGIFTE